MSEQVQLWETYNDKGFKAKLSEFAEKDAAGNDIATSLGNRYTKGETDNLLNGKEDKIDDLETIRSNASKGATAIQGVQRNGTDLTPDANSKVNVEVPVLGIQVNNADITPDQSTRKVNLTVLDTISAGSDYPVSSKTIYTALDEIYTKTETNEAIAAAVADFGGFKVVELGPDGKPAEQSPSTKIIYLTKDDPATKTDPYTEWICTDTTGPVWEIIGETSVDLSQYYTKTEADARLANKVTVVIGKGLSTEDYTTPEKTKLAGISDGANKVEPSQTNGNIKVDGTETTVYAHPAGSENVSGLYKVATDSTGHVTSATAVVKADITDLGIPAQDTTYESKTAAQGGTDVSLVTTGEKYTWNQKYDLPVNGIPKNELAQEVQDSLDAADTALQPADIDGYWNGAVIDSGSGNVVSGVSVDSSTGRVTVTKTSIVPSDSTPLVASGNGDAGTDTEYARADHVHPSDSTKADKVSGATDGNFAGLNANGNLVDSGSKAADFATAAQGALADTAYQKPSTGIPSTDLEQAVQDSLDLADTAYQKPSAGIPSTDLDQASQTSLGLADTAVQDANYVHTDNNYTAAEKDKLGNIEAGAQVNVQADWNATVGADNEILNKPTIGNGTLSITVGSAAAQTFTANQETNESITIPLAAVDNTGSTPVYTEGLMSAADKAKVEGIADKADKVTSATPNNFVSLASGGNLADSGYSANSFATAAQGALADSSIQGVTVDNGSPLTPVSGVVNIDLSGKVDKVTGKGLSTNDYDDTDKATVTKAAAVIPSDAKASNQLVSYETMTAALANFIGMKISTGTGTDMHPDEQNPNTKTIYLVLDSSATGNDKYKEWIYSTTNTWTLIGDTTVDLSGYVQYPATHTDTHLVAFGPNESIADTGKTVADLTNSVETVSIGSGSGISPTSGTTDINIPLATNVNNVGTDGAMAGADKVKLDGIAPGAQVNTVNTVSIGNGSGIAPTTGTTDINIPMATSSVDGAMSRADKGKLDGITAGAEPNVQSSWTEADSTSDAYIANKPDIIIPQPSPAALGGIAAPKYLMVVTSMPAAADIDPDTIYLVQGTYIGT